MNDNDQQFGVFAGGSPADERDARLTEGADELAGRRRSILQHPRFLIWVSATLITVGLSLILLGWAGASRSIVLEEQLPYLISGGVFGLALTVIGAMTLFAQWLTTLIREEREREVARRQDHEAALDALGALTDAITRQESGNGRARSARGLTVRFGELLAVDNVDLQVDVGRIVGLIGPNGAGKTTTFNALSGVQRCAGTVTLDGVDVSKAPPHERARLGLNRTFQRLEVFGSMTTYDNLRTAAEITARVDAPGSAPRPGSLTRSSISCISSRSRAAGADALPTGQARLVELGRALATKPKVLLLDEPASGLDDVETSRLSETLEMLAEQEMAILLVEHDVELVMNLCSTVFVLDLGALIATGTPKQIRKNPAVRDAYLGAMSE